MATTISTRNGYKPSFIPAAIAALLVFPLYLATLAPSVAMWDTGEYMVSAKVLGLPHPPGNPFFMLLAHAFASLPIPVSYGARSTTLPPPPGASWPGPGFLTPEKMARG